MSAKAKIITLVIVFLLAVGVSVYGIVTGDEEIREEIPRMIVVAISFAAVIVKVATGQDTAGRKSLAFYEKSYKKEIGNAFSEDKKKRKALLEATRLYNENKYEKSVKMLTELMREAYSRDDRLAVGLFLGLNYTDMGEGDKAYEVYRPFVDTREATDTIYINCGHLMQTYFGDGDKALYYYEKAAQLNSKNDIVCNNIADMYFSKGDFDNAIEYAKKALDINPNRHESSTLLAIIYSCRGNDTEAEKYTLMAINSGRDKKELKNAIEYYKMK